MSDNNPHPEQTESGFIDVKTAKGRTLSIFALNTADFERLTPSEAVYREVALLMRENDIPRENTITRMVEQAPPKLKRALQILRG